MFNRITKINERKRRVLIENSNKSSETTKKIEEYFERENLKRFIQEIEYSYKRKLVVIKVKNKTVANEILLRRRTLAEILDKGMSIVIK